MEDPSRLLSYRELSAKIGVPVATLYSWVSLGRVPHIRFSGRLVRFDPAAIAQWLAARAVKPREELAPQAGTPVAATGRPPPRRGRR